MKEQYLHSGLHLLLSNEPIILFYADAQQSLDLTGDPAHCLVQIYTHLNVLAAQKAEDCLSSLCSSGLTNCSFITCTEMLLL